MSSFTRRLPLLLFLLALPVLGQVKPTINDTIRLTAYADNWFAVFINGKLVAADAIDFLPHNQIAVRVLPEYPLTIAVLAKDNAEPATGLEYGNRIGDAGFILRLGDSIVTNSRWKAKAFHRGPLNRDTVNPRVERTPLPAGWHEPGFDDSAWPNAREYPVEQVRPDGDYVADDFTGARFIWSEDLELDNTVILRTTVPAPTGWVRRWNTSPDLDVTALPREILGESPAPAAAGRLANLSTRAQVGTGEAVLIPGFVLAGDAPRRVLVRAIGPGLAAFGVAGALADPTLEVLRGSQVVAANDNWQSQPAGASAATAAVESGAFPLAAGSRDAALVVSLAPGAYTLRVAGVGGATGVALAEIYLLP
jgi:hypothetical protein